MDNLTREYYQQRAHELIPQYDSFDQTHLVRLTEQLPPPVRVLDVGCGTGRDIAWLLDHGYNAWGFDASEAMIRAGAHHYDIEPGRMVEATLPDMNGLASAASFREPFDAIVCKAVLQHLSDDEVPRAIENLAEHLVPNGTLIINIPVVRGGITNDRDDAGRLFRLRSPSFYGGAARRHFDSIHSEQHESPTFAAIWEIQIYRRR